MVHRAEHSQTSMERLEGFIEDTAGAVGTDSSPIEGAPLDAWPIEEVVIWVISEGSAKAARF